MRTELPTRGQIIEELADRVGAQIDQGKPVAFDNALAELVRYHRFVLGLGASTGPDGAPFNYSELAGAAWHPPHAEWLSQYRRLFEKGAERIPDNDHFLVALAHAQGQLFELSDGLVASTALIDAVLNLFPSLIFSVERWVTRRAIVHGDPDVSGKRPQVLAGSDAKAHASTLRRLVGAWESLFGHSSIAMDLDRRHGRTPEDLWESAQRAWSFAWRHLQNTAFCVAIAVWNDDAEGAAVFREALVRWPETIRHQLPHPLYLHLPEPLFPDILELDLENAQARIRTFAYAHNPPADPMEILSTVVRQAHDDVIQLLAGLIAFWGVSGKKAAPLGAKIAAELLAGTGADDHGQLIEPVSSGALLLRYLRLQMAGERYQGGTYGAALDNFVQRLDSMTEREVVSGRTYSPSTLHDREGALSGDVAVLAAFIDNAKGPAVNDRMREIAEAEEVLPNGDRTLRAMIYEIDRYLSVIEANSPEILGTIEGLGGEAPEHQLQLLGELLKSVRTTIGTYRARRLRERPVDPEKLEIRRAAVETELLDPENLKFFVGAGIEQDAGAVEGPICTFRRNSPKSRLVTPSMGAEVSNEVEATARDVAACADSRSVRSVFDLPTLDVAIEAMPVERRFWDDIRPLVTQVGESPRLLVPARFNAGLLHIMFHHKNSELADLAMSGNLRRLGYICTIDGVDVHRGRSGDDAAWLLSGGKLKRIAYGLVNEEQFVSVDYVPDADDPEANEGTLEYRFRQSLEWDDSPVFRISLPGETADEVKREAVASAEKPAARPAVRLRRIRKIKA